MSQDKGKHQSDCPIILLKLLLTILLVGLILIATYYGGMRLIFSHDYIGCPGDLMPPC